MSVPPVNDRLYVLHVAKEGSEPWNSTSADRSPNGASEGPLATVAAARDRLRELRQQGKLSGPAEVRIHGGTYEMTESLCFTAEDLTDGAAPVAYTAAGDGEVRLIGGVTLTGFTPHIGKIVKLDLRKIGRSGLRFRQLIYKGVKQRLARYPHYCPDNPYGGGWLYVEGEPVDMYADGHGKKDRFICKDERLKAWGRVDEVELFIFPRFNYTNDIARLRSYDPDTGEVVLASPALYAIYPGDRFYFQNVREELAAPGEWYLDEAADTLYFHPPEQSDPDRIEVTATLVEHLIDIRGVNQQTENLYTEKVDWWESGGFVWLAERLPALSEAGHLSFIGLTLEGCGGSAVLMRDAADCRVSGCTVRNTGASGITVLGGWRARVTDNDIYETGSHGLYLSGGIRNPFAGRFVPSGHEAVNNYIHHVGTVYKSVAGISLNGVGIRAAHNLIHDGPRWGIQSRGNDNVIEYNHIRHVNIETSDTSAIYLVDRDMTIWGTKIRYNHIHDVLGYHLEEGEWRSPAFAFGIYLDDFTSGVEVVGNLTCRTPGGGLYIHAGQGNLVENNMFLDTVKETAKFRRWRAEMEFKTIRSRGQGLRRNVIRTNIFATAGAEAVIFRFDTALDEHRRLDLASNRWENNLVWQYDRPPMVRVTSGELDFKISYAEWSNEYGDDQGSVAADPRFAGDASAPYRLREDSPAYAMGFAPLPLERMGPYRSEYRTVWPIREAEGVREYPVKPSAIRED